MPTTEHVAVKKLTLDLKNYRTTPQKTESDAIKAMIIIKPDKFYAVLESLLEDGYLQTESIQVLKRDTKLEVKEGNRRIAAMKLIHGYHKVNDFGIPEAIKEKIRKVGAKWKKENEKVPCTIYSMAEIDKVNRIVNLTHAKGERASRDGWNSVATARNNRDAKGGIEPSLDVLEKYLKQGQNLSGQQKDRWSGEYNLTVLGEAMRKLHSRMGYATVDALVKAYPKIKGIAGFEEMLRDIGLEQLKFPIIRNPNVDFGILYGFNPPPPPPANTNTPGAGVGTGTNNSTSQTGNTGNNQGTGSSTGNKGKGNGTGTNGNQSQGPNNSGTTTKPPAKAHATNDPKSVTVLLKKFSPRGSNREKVVALRDELKNLNIENNPIAFCFILRSMFEISAKVYSKEKGLALTKPTGKGTQTKEKSLKELLTGATKHLTAGNQPMTKILHGAMTELSQPDRLLSVTSMNQLVHNDSFSVAPADVCRLFHKVCPLLEALN